jgi:hypothetical protein
MAEAEYRRTLDAHAVLDFSDVLRGRSTCCGRWTSSRRAATASSRAITTCSWTSSRTRAARSGSWSRCSSVVGRGRGPRARAARCRRRSSSSATASSRSTASATPTSRAGDEPAAASRRCARRRRPALDLAQLPRGAGAARLRQRRLRDMDKVAGARDAFRYGRRPLSDDRAGAGPPATVLGVVAADSVEACAARRAEIARLLRGRRARPRDRRARGRRSRGRRHPVPLAREPPRVRGRARERGIPAYVYKGLGFFDADEIKDVLALLRYLADPASDLRAAACCARGSCGCRTRASPAGAAARGGAARRPACPGRRAARRSTTGSRALAARASRRRAGGARRSAAARRAARPRAAESATPSSCGGRAARRRARTSRRCARSCAGSRTAATRRWPPRRAPRPPVGGRRVQRHDRRGRRREPDDRARGQGARVPGGVRGQPDARHRRRARSDSRG